MHRTIVIPQESYKKAKWLLWGLIIINCIVGLDLLVDYFFKVKIEHLYLDQGICLTLTIVIAFVYARYNKKTSCIYAQLLQARQLLGLKEKEIEKLRKGLLYYIETQFNDWKLTSTEKDVALLLIKGFTTKEIATFRNCKESTTRQQAYAIYKKSGLSGRNELTAFFLEDLLD